jgi:glutamate--cysteine ligase catalytic subunit
MEVQLTDFGNAAFLVFLALFRQFLDSDIGCQLDLHMPLDLVRENMQRAHARDAVLAQKLWFPYDGAPVEMTLDEIVNGCSKFPGLLPTLETYVSSSQHHPDNVQWAQLQKYLGYIKNIAAGSVPTTARWMRDFIRSHEGYLQDSVVSTNICYDMLVEAKRLS